MAAQDMNVETVEVAGAGLLDVNGIYKAVPSTTPPEYIRTSSKTSKEYKICISTIPDYDSSKKNAKRNVWVLSWVRDSNAPVFLYYARFGKYRENRVPFNGFEALGGFQAPSVFLSSKANPYVLCQSFGTYRGKNVNMYLLRNKTGLEIEIVQFGGHIRSLRVPNANGGQTDVTIGLDTLEDYTNRDKNRFFGSLVGRYANRIAKGKFKLNKITHKLAVNNGPNALHGGIEGFDKKVWDTKILTFDDSKDDDNAYACGLEMKYHSPNGEEGYSGTCDVTVQYLVPLNKNSIEIRYVATTDSATVVNLTNHAYFNLDGDFNDENICSSHYLRLDCDKYTPVDVTSIPTGVLKNVSNTMFDFRKSRPIGQGDGNGYDHNFVINHKNLKQRTVIECAEVRSENTGIVMRVWTDQPGVQFYTGNYLDESKYRGKGQGFGRRGAFCLETQHFPDSPNRQHFPSTVITKSSPLKTTTIYAFETS